MDLSILLAKIYGATYVALGLAFLFNTAYYRNIFIKLMQSKSLIFVWGIVAFVIGLVIVLHHNIWEASWVVIITIVGWIALIKGAVSILLPQMFGMFESWFKKKWLLGFTGVFALIFGAVLCYFGFLI